MGFAMKKKSAEYREFFSEKMIKILNYGAINLAMAVGYRSGLFDVMDSFDSPQTVDRIAEKAELDPRYLREWLGVMVTAEIVELYGGTGGQNQYFLPKYRGDYITRRAGNANLGVYTQEIPLLTVCAMEAVIEGFTTGEGVTYDHYPKFQAFMSQLANAKHRQILVDKFLPSVDNGRLVERLRSGIQVCDLGCAEGIALMLMARAFPKSRFTGIDISREAIDEARRQAREKQIENLEFLKLDAAFLSSNAVLAESNPALGSPAGNLSYSGSGRPVFNDRYCGPVEFSGQYNPPHGTVFICRKFNALHAGGFGGWGNWSGNDVGTRKGG
jgi:hypothetical protein